MVFWLDGLVVLRSELVVLRRLRAGSGPDFGSEVLLLEYVSIRSASIRFKSGSASSSASWASESSGELWAADRKVLVGRLSVEEVAAVVVAGGGAHVCIAFVLVALCLAAS